MKLTSIDTSNINNEIIKDVLFNTPRIDYQRADYAIIFGCHLKPLLDERITHAIKVLNNKQIDKIIVTGGVGVQGDFDESEYIIDKLLQSGISDNKIVVENKSTTTEENVANTVDILRNTNTIRNSNIILISSQAHLRRLAMEYKKQLYEENITIVCEYPSNSIISFENIIKDDESKAIAVNEVKKIINFINCGIIDDEDI